MKKNITLSLLLFCICMLAQSQNDSFQKKEFIYKGDTLRYRVLFPKNYDKSKTYPLVLFLHGSGEKGNDNTKQLVWGASLFTDSLNRQNYPAIVLFPQCPVNQSWMTITERSDTKFNLLDPKEPAKPLFLAKKLVDFVQKTEAVNRKRIYVLGLSLGGMGTFDLICRYPNLFAAAIPICGAVNVDRLKKVTKMPIRIYNGDSDNIVSPEYSRNAFIELKADGSQQVEHIEFPGVGHNSWTPAFAEPDFLKWLFSQKK
ncbi:MAG: alpha/beta hydrolase-fold protein [Paludibacter sp.]|nr:alpha/beta hydrolase-fold protein [Paludibacter sp.]